MSQLLTMILTLNIYEAMLIGLAVFLLRRGIKRDAMILLIIEAFFLADVGFLNMEVFARSPWIGLVVNTFVLAAAVIKVAMVFRAAGIPLVDGKFAFVVIQLGVFLAKVLIVCSFQILVRWTLPRFRYDQLLRFAWKFMFPLAIANLVVTAVVVWLLGASPA